MNLFNNIKQAFLLSIVFIIICGFCYPLLLTGLGQLIFPWQANGSIIEKNGVAVGSELVGQNFTDVRFMKGRPSAVDFNTYTEQNKKDGLYQGPASGSYNYAPSNPALKERVELDMADFLKNNPEKQTQDVPGDLLTASGSGLDPHISPAAALVQITALASNTGLPESKLAEIVQKNTQKKLLGIFGEDTVNVLKVNLDIAEELGLLNFGH